MVGSQLTLRVGSGAVRANRPVHRMQPKNKNHVIPSSICEGPYAGLKVRMLPAGAIFPPTAVKVAAVIRSLRLRSAQRRDDMRFDGSFCKLVALFVTFMEILIPSHVLD